MNGTGTAIVDFGAFPGSNEASVAVTGQTTISATSKAEAYIMSDTTSDHTANDHAYVNILAGFICDTPVAATGFNIIARSAEQLQGTFQLRWVWSD